MQDNSYFDVVGRPSTCILAGSQQEIAGPGMDDVTRGGTSWRRTGILLLPALLGVLVLAAMAIRGHMALNLAITGQEFKIKAENAEAPQGLSAYPSGVRMKNGDHHDPVLLAALPEAKIPDGLCVSLSLTFPIIGTNTLRLYTTGATRVTDMTASASALDVGNVSIKDLTAPMSINKDASELTGVEGGQPGSLGLEAPGSAHIGTVQGTAKGAVIAGTLTISGIKIPQVGHGDGPDQECY
jgi:hypothetical protein